MASVKSLKAMLDAIDSGGTTFSKALEDAEAKLSEAKANIGALRELGKLLKATTAKLPRAGGKGSRGPRKKKDAPQEASPAPAEAGGTEEAGTDSE